MKIIITNNANNLEYRKGQTGVFLGLVQDKNGKPKIVVAIKETGDIVYVPNFHLKVSFLPKIN